MRSPSSVASSSTQKVSTTRRCGDLPACVLAGSQLALYHGAPGEKGVSNWMAPIDKCLQWRPVESFLALISTAVLGLVTGRGFRRVAIHH